MHTHSLNSRTLNSLPELMRASASFASVYRVGGTPTVPGGIFSVVNMTGGRRSLQLLLKLKYRCLVADLPSPSTLCACGQQRVSKKTFVSRPLPPLALAPLRGGHMGGARGVVCDLWRICGGRACLMD